MAHAPSTSRSLEHLFHERIVLLDGAMGTMIQRYNLSEADYRGKRFADWSGKDLKGSLELLNLTQPQTIEEIHAQYLDASADIIETNTFSATTIASERSSRGRSMNTTGWCPTTERRRSPSVSCPSSYRS